MSRYKILANRERGNKKLSERPGDQVYSTQKEITAPYNIAAGNAERLFRAGVIPDAERGRGLMG